MSLLLSFFILNANYGTLVEEYTQNMAYVNNYTSAYISEESPEDGLVVWMTKA